MLLSVTMAMTMMPIMTGDGLNEEDNDNSEDNDHSHGDCEQYVYSDESDNVYKGKNKVLNNLSADHPWCIRLDWHEIE